MLTEIQLSNLEFIERTMRLDGKPWSFANRPYIIPIINERPTKLLLMAGRQSEKSTTLSGKHLTSACKNAYMTSLYVSPTMIQTSVYSKKKIDSAIEQSRIIKENYFPGARGMSVTEKKLKNDHTMYFRSAHRTADTIRGLSADDVLIDEIQDILTDNIPIIEECSSHKQLATFSYSGTPKSLANPIESYWCDSTMNEFTILCMHCGNWNTLSINNIQIGKPGRWCEKCGRDIYIKHGIWVRHGKEDADIVGYRLPQIILPDEYINWKRLFTKMEKYNTATLMNEVFGHSYDSGVKPISQTDVITCCSDRNMEEVCIYGSRGFEMFAGIDWAAGTGKCYTVLTLGYFDPTRDRIIVTFAKRFEGKEAEPELMLSEMVKIIQNNNARFVGVDYGFGFGMNARLEAMLGPRYIVAVFMHTGSKHFVNYNKKAKSYILGRTTVMSDVIESIKKRFFEFPRWEDYSVFAQDFLNIEAEYNERTGHMSYTHLPPNPDDSFHSLLYLYVFFLIRTKRRTPGSYDEREEEKNERASLS